MPRDQLTLPTTAATPALTFPELLDRTKAACEAAEVVQDAARHACDNARQGLVASRERRQRTRDTRVVTWLNRLKREGGG
jgi:hypothetical protein